MTTASSNVLLLPRGPVIYRGSVVWALAQCEVAIVAFYCASHDEEFPTRAHLTAHCKSEEPHQIVRLCAKHGVEAISPKEET